MGINVLNNHTSKVTEINEDNFANELNSKGFLVANFDKLCVVF